ncbi:reverse transcriptase family protein [Proteus mirabilis]|uniref:reverse transcriptase family protein n=1 Tax=Proteus mirabilis TaxID=584 RepID=UPI000C12A7BB|nr:reverse transcriptase family protein [Proteus mirabilis]MBB6652802.1 RNA-directed DNA polymerase [Proteus mirabilis]UZK71177.1 reverse transcriptase family protein [Proteus mirabilis]HEI9867034.1 RNA-directed DNA polymerase [Proteus mirabilis]HEJ9519962.1 RNA-directed DNA polymerase [Proteus mirabilis]HEK3138263.1 RNA-directed DNA polymerase [Proteus mirabilis]
MTIGPTHTYIQEGLEKGIPENKLRSIVRESLSRSNTSVPFVFSLKHVCHFTGASYPYLREIIRRRQTPYSFHKIPKKRGGHRFLTVPDIKLKRVQNWINRDILASQIPHFRCYSYHSKSSIFNCAREHCSSKWLIKIDVENFFDSISEVMVYKVFRSLGYKPLLAFELGRICTYQPTHLSIKNTLRWCNFNKNSSSYPYKRIEINFFGRLPQGAPTSPMLSNLVFQDIDEELHSYASSNGVVYTRYADDLTFSTSNRQFSRKKALIFVNKVKKILRTRNFSTNKSKLKIIPPGSRKVVLGLNIDGPNPLLLKGFKKRLEGHLRGIEKFGIQQHLEHKHFQTVFGMISHINGLIGYASQIDYEYGNRLKAKFSDILTQNGIVNESFQS